MSTTLKVSLLAILATLQIGSTASSIVKYETTLRSGTAYRILSNAIDPADPFRGRYVTVRPTITMRAPIPPETVNLLERIQSGETGYAVLAEDADGFARAAQLVMQKPAGGDYLEIAHVWPQWQESTVPNTPSVLAGYNLQFSFDRYYMNDAVAPQAQERARQAPRANAESRTWLAVRVKNGIGVIEGMFIDGVPIERAVGK